MQMTDTTRERKQKTCRACVCLLKAFRSRSISRVTARLKPRYKSCALQVAGYELITITRIDKDGGPKPSRFDNNQPRRKQKKKKIKRGWYHTTNGGRIVVEMYCYKIPRLVSDLFLRPVIISVSIAVAWFGKPIGEFITRPTTPRHYIIIIIIIVS